MTADEINAIKKKVKAEMQRRHGTGSMATYAGTNWDFTALPATGGKVQTEHGHKVIAPIIAVKPQGNLTDAAAGAKIPSDFNTANLNKIVDTYAAEATTTPHSSCQASCSGLCTTGCYSGCSGCLSSCINGCAYECTNSCTASCMLDCVTGCENTCKITCFKVCLNSCVGGCESGCEGGCEGTCRGICAHVASF